jgi:hypothetical protein
MKAKGILSFNRMLYAKDITAFNKFLHTKPSSEKPNGGIYPLSFDKEYTRLEMDSTEVYEVERIVAELIKVIEYEELKELSIIGQIVCIDTEDHEMSYKVHVNDNGKIYKLKLTEELPEPERYLECPHCRKVFKMQDYKEMLPERQQKEEILPSWSISKGTEAY